MRWLRLCGWEEGAAVAEIGSTTENLRDGGAFSGSAWRKAVPGFGVLQAATPEGCMTVDMIGEAEDRRMKEAAIKDALRRRIEGGHDPKTLLRVTSDLRVASKINTRN